MSKYRNKVSIRLTDSDQRELDRMCDQIRQDLNMGGASRAELVRAVLFTASRELKATDEEPTAQERGRLFEASILEQIDQALFDADVFHLEPEQGKNQADIRGPFFDLELKTGRRPSTRSALAQCQKACDDSGSGQVPVAVIKDEGDSDPFCVIPWPAFLVLWRCLWEHYTFASGLNLMERLNDGERVE